MEEHITDQAELQNAEKTEKELAAFHEQLICQRRPLLQQLDKLQKEEDALRALEKQLQEEINAEELQAAEYADQIRKLKEKLLEDRQNKDGLLQKQRSLQLDLDSVSNELEELTEQQRKLTEDLKNIEQQYNKINEQVQSARDQIEVNSFKIQQNELEKTTTAQNMSDLQEESQSVSNDIKIKTTLCTERQDKLTLIEDELAQSCSQISRLESGLLSLREDLKSIEKDISDLENTIQTLETAIQYMTAATVLAAALGYGEFSLAAINALQVIKQGFEQRLSKLTAKTDRIKVDVENNETKLGETRKAHQVLGMDKIQAERSISDLMQEKQDLEIKHADLEQKYSRLNCKKCRLAAENRRLHIFNVNLEKEEKTGIKQSELFAMKLNHINKSITEATQKQKELQSNHATLSKELTEVAQDVAETEKNLNEVKNSYCDLTRKLTNKSDELAEIRKKNEQTKMGIDDVVEESRNLNYKISESRTLIKETKLKAELLKKSNRTHYSYN